MKRRDDLFINYDDVQEESSFPDHFRILDASDINQLQRVYPKIVNEIKGFYTNFHLIILF